MTHLVSPISIDLGAKFTGVHLGNYTEGESFLDGEYKGVVIVDNNKKTWSQANRRTTRHTQRALNRRRMAKRFLRLILKQGLGLDLNLKINQQQTLEEFLMGMLNRRGYTYIDEGIDYDALEGHELKYDFFNKIEEAPQSGETLYGFFERIVREKRCSSIREKIKEEKNVKGRTQLVTIKAFKDFDDAFDALEKAIDGGHKHREDYLETIKRDIEKFVSKEALQGKLSQEEVWKIVGNISNFQLRFLRKYFNDERMGSTEIWEEDKFNKLFNRYISAWHVGTEKEKSRLKELRSTPHKGGIDLLRKVNPKLTIPPFEDQNNRHPPTCEVLLLKPERLDQVLPSWKNFAAKVSSDYQINFEFPEIPKRSEWDLARKFQMYLDQMMKEKPAKRIDAILAYLVNNEKDERLLEFLKQYYSEQYEARYGYWIQNEQSVLSTCGLKAKHKSNMTHYLVGDILSARNFFGSQKSVDEFKNYLRSNKVGRRSLLGVMKACSETQEDLGNMLNSEIKKIERNNPDGDRDIKKLIDEVKLVSKEIQKHLCQNDDQMKRYSNIYSFAQLYNHLESDIHGFSKTCIYCSKDNSFRSNQENGENIARLSRGTEKPIDGIVGRLLDSIAWKIALVKEEQLRSYQHIQSISGITLPVVIEENTFSFSFDLKDIKKQQDASARSRLNKGQDKDKKKTERTIKRFEEKWERIKNDSKGICPYTGESISGAGEFDHIIPRSSTKNQYQTVFNSECNLIYCSNAGNIKKGKSCYTLENLNSKYLQAIFGKSDITAIRNELIESFNKLNEESKKGRLDLFDEEVRKTLRFALFVDETKDNATWLLNKMAATRVNGTQKYLAALISEKIDRIVERNPGLPKIEKKFVFVNAMERSDLRELLSYADPLDIRWKKDGPQSIQSHIIDAALVYARACEDRKIAYDLSTENIVFSEDSIREIQKIIPENFSVSTLESKHETEKDVSSNKILAATMTSENYFPILAHKLDGKISWKIGFGKDNAVTISEGKKAPDWKKYLLPFAEYKEQKISSFDDISSSLGEGKTLYFTLNKTKIYEENRRLKTEKKCLNEELVSLLETLAYRTKKEICENLFVEQKNNKNVGIYPLDGLKEYYQKKIGKCPFTEGGVVELPVKSSLEKIHKAIEGTPVEKLSTISWKEFFPVTVQASKEHKAVKKTYSLPILTTEGNIRVRRMNPKKESVWQLQKNSSILNTGFQIQNNKITGIPTQVASQYSFEIPLESPKEIISMAKFISIDVPQNLKENGIVSISYRLSEAKRRRCRVGISKSILSTVLPHVDTRRLEASYSIKEHKNVWFSEPLLKNMRDDRFDLVALDNDFLLIEFTHDGNADVDKAIVATLTKR